MNNKYVMQFSPKSQRWFVVLSDREYGINCGESFIIFIHGKPLACRMELGMSWYIVIGDIRLDLRESDQYMVAI